MEENVSGCFFLNTVYVEVCTMKWLWFVPNLLPIRSIFLKVQTVKQIAAPFLP